VTDVTHSNTEVLAAHILAYLTSNPHAADTVQGIQNWWLSSAATEVNVVDVECAIAALVRRGVLECRTLPDGTRIYARAEPLARSVVE
jgi:hypothetical protein